MIAKRPLANAPWRHAERPAGEDVEAYWERFRAMDLDPRGLPWDELALRFAAYQPGVHACIAGTSSPDHLKRDVEAVAKGPLPDEHVAAIRAAFRSADHGWVGMV